ncbi:MAG: hypothetical protein AB7U73_03035 [Pirellulales bacterium]
MAGVTIYALAVGLIAVVRPQRGTNPSAFSMILGSAGGLAILALFVCAVVGIALFLASLWRHREPTDLLAYSMVAAIVGTVVTFLFVPV